MSSMSVMSLVSRTSNQWSSLITDHISSFQRSMPVCPWNCSGHGTCKEGKCVCFVQFSGGSCKDTNKDYHLAFGSIFVVLAFVTFVQLVIPSALAL